MLTSSCVVNSAASQTCVGSLAAVCSSHYGAALLLSPQAPKAVRCFPLGLNSRYSAASGQIFLLLALTPHISKAAKFAVMCFAMFLLQSQLNLRVFLSLLISGLRKSCESMI